MRNSKAFLAALSAICISFSASASALAEGDEPAAGNAAKIGETEYLTFDAAVQDASDGDTVTLISDIADIGNITISKNITLDGDGHTISGNSALYIGSDADVTIQDTKFSEIKDPAERQLSSIYASIYSGELTIKNCEFTDIEYEALQSTPQDNAVFNIINNTFNNVDCTTQQRYIHIEARTSDGRVYADNDIKVTIKNNAFNNTDNLNQSSMEIYGFFNPEEINVSGNYFAGSIVSKYGVVHQWASGKWINYSAKMYPRYEEPEMITEYTPAAIEYAAYGINAEYDTVQAAIVNNVSEINLTDDVTEDITVPAGKTVTLNLNGHKITNVSNHTISNYGKLTINGPGTVDNVTHGKAAVYNGVGGEAVLAGGTYTRSKEAGSSADNNGGNSFYYIQNQGTMTLGDIKVSSEGVYSSLIANGWQDGNLNDSKSNSVLIINGGTYEGGINTIKNDDYGVLTINDGTFTNMSQYAVMNWNVAEINGGTFESTTKSDSLVNGYVNDYMDKGELVINGGTFSGGISINSQSESTDKAKENISVAGGTYTADITPYMADGTAYSVAGDEYTVYSADNKITGAGTYMTPAAGGTYDQLTTVTKTIGSESVNVNTLKFDITIGNDNKTQYTYKGDTTFTNATVLFGLVVTDIPEGETVTVTMN